MANGLMTTVVREARIRYSRDLAREHGHWGPDPSGMGCAECQTLLTKFDADPPSAERALEMLAPSVADRPISQDCSFRPPPRLEAHDASRLEYAISLAYQHGHYAWDPGGICCSICRPLIEAWDEAHPEPPEEAVTEPAKPRRRRKKQQGLNISDAAFSPFGGSAEFHALALSMGAVNPENDMPIVWPKRIA